MKNINLLMSLQFVKFCIVGLSNTILSYLIYLCLIMFFRNNFKVFKYDYLITQFLAFILSVAWSYYWNNKFVFKQKHNANSLIKTYISYSFTGIFFNSILLYLWVDLLNISEIIGPILNLFISVPVNFLLRTFSEIIYR